ncbi:MAG: ATP synthase F0 subunit B [Lachnospiraceae bacterium]|nr:ATP synthase F0 subunit B [Lachnospiraceae bacterium]
MPLNINIQQILLHMFNFVLLFGISYFLLYTPIKKFMDERKKYYEDMDKEANQKIKDAEVAKNEYENRLSLLDDDIAQKKSEALAEAQEKRDQIIDKARAEAEEIIESAKKVSAFERERNIARAKEEIEAYVTKAAKEIVMSGDPYENFANAAKKESNDD